MARNLTHPEMIRQASMYLDNELSPEAQTKFQKELDKSPEFQQILTREQQIRDIIRTKSQRSCSPNLLESIKEKIRIAPA